MNLRPFQEQLAARAALALRDYRAVVLQLGTGGGKTHTAATIIARRLVKVPASRVGFLAGLDSILDDTLGRLRAADLHAGLVQADRPTDPSAPVQVMSWATIAARGARPELDFIVVDECHHAAADTVRTILEAYPKAYILGLTATPQRGDGKPLGTAGFKALVSGPSNAELCREGYLVPLDVVGPAVQTDGVAIDPLDAWQRWAGGRRTVAFCRSVADAEQLAARMVDAGIAARVLTGETPSRERTALRAALTAGDVRVICTVDVLREGWDCPAAEVALFDRPVSVVGGWLQMLGRVSRPAPGKTRALAIDLHESWLALGLRDDARVWSLDGTAVAPAERLPPFRRCLACAAVFTPAAVCPRCGVACTAATVERRERTYTNAEKLALVSHLSEAERDRRYLASLRRVATTRVRLAGEDAERWARRAFRKQRGRDPIAEVANG